MGSFKFFMGSTEYKVTYRADLGGWAIWSKYAGVNYRIGLETVYTTKQEAVEFVGYYG